MKPGSGTLTPYYRAKQNQKPETKTKNQHALQKQLIQMVSTMDPACPVASTKGLGTLTLGFRANGN